MLTSQKKGVDSARYIVYEVWQLVRLVWMGAYMKSGTVCCPVPLVR